KRFNRKLELALRETEWTAVLAAQYANFTYPQAALEAIWKEALLYQFHDILPGSSITRVYDESRTRYQVLLVQTYKLLGEAQAALIGALDTQGFDKPVVAMNSLSWDREEWVKVDGTWMKLRVPAMGCAAVELAQTQIDEPDLHADARRLEN